MAPDVVAAGLNCAGTFATTIDFDWWTNLEPGSQLRPENHFGTVNAAEYSVFSHDNFNSPPPALFRSTEMVN
jgi:hypothetical protein